ncbi:hypothetical protein TDB9533_00512 [Thalassocella blandensis]|nr:hypothetical protein TDB9533_00512 [Thalassocella blandensis]
MVRTQFKIHQWILLVLAVFAIAACGGGGGGGGNNTPQFSFTAKSDQALSTVVASNASTVTRIGNSAPVAIQNGEYSIDGGDFVSSAGTISEGQSIVVRGTSSAEFETSVTVTLTIKETSKTFVIITAAQDVTPEEFSFTAQTGAELSTEYFSNTVTVTGITGDVDISVENGTYQINEAAATSEPGSISNGADLIVAGMSSSEFETTTTVTLTIGATSKAFDITTAAMDTTPEDFAFAVQTNATLETAYTSNLVTITGINAAAAISISGSAQYSIDEGDFTNEAGTIMNGQTVAIKATSATTNSTTSDFVLTVGGKNATFSITTIADSIPPTAAIVFPTKVSLTDGQTLTVRGTAEDLSGIESVMVTVMNDEIQVSQVVATSFDDEGYARWTAEVTLDVDAVNTVTVSVTDKATNTNSDADSVAVTHSLDYFALDFPEGSEAGMYEVDSDNLILDKANSRLLFSDQIATDNIVAIDMATSVRTVFLPEQSGFDYLFGMEIVGNELFAVNGLGGSGEIFKTNLSAPSVEIVSDINNENSNVDIVSPRSLKWNEVSELLYVVDHEGKTLYSVDPISGDRMLVSGENRPVDGENPLSFPLSLALDHSDAEIAYVLDLLPDDTNKLLQINLTSGVRTTLIDVGTVEKLLNIELDAARNRILLANDEPAEILSYDLEGGEIGVVFDGSVGPNSFLKPDSLEIDTETDILFFLGNKWLTDCSIVYAADMLTNERVVMTKSECIN